MTSNVLEARGLTRSFGSVPAVRGLDLEVRSGELVAFLGPNGAGKSTSLPLLLAGVLLPLATAPGWMRAAAAANPLPYLVDAERALFAGQVLTRPVAEGLVAAVVTAVVGVRVGTRAMRRA